MKLQAVLQRSGRAEIDLDSFRADQLKKAARFWVGKEAAAYNKQKCIDALREAFQKASSAQTALATLPDKQRQVLSIVACYGPVVSEPLLTAELRERGLVEKPEKSPGYGYGAYYGRSRNDLVHGLCEKLVLIGSGYDSYYSGSYGRSSVQLTLHPGLAKVVTPAKPLPWRSSAACDEVKGASRRSPAEVTMDLWRVAQALRAMGTWPTVRGGALAKSLRKRLHKELKLRSADEDPLSPPGTESLCYEVLKTVGCIDLQHEASWGRQEVLEAYFQLPVAAEAWHWVRAWLDLRLWQDGIGVVSERGSGEESDRIDPEGLFTAKELLAWALGRVAHTADQWLDLETFLKDFWHAAYDDSGGFYRSRYTWQPGFEMARRKM